MQMRKLGQAQPAKVLLSFWFGACLPTSGCSFKKSGLQFGASRGKKFFKKDVSKIKDLLCSLLMDYRAAVKAHSRLFHSFKLKQTAPSPPSFAVFVLDYFSSCAYIHISPAQFDHTLCF